MVDLWLCTHIYTTFRCRCHSPLLMVFNLYVTQDYRIQSTWKHRHAAMTPLFVDTLATQVEDQSTLRSGGVSMSTTSAPLRMTVDVHSFTATLADGKILQCIRVVLPTVLCFVCWKKLGLFRHQAVCTIYISQFPEWALLPVNVWIRRKKIWVNKKRITKSALVTVELCFLLFYKNCFKSGSV